MEFATTMYEKDRYSVIGKSRPRTDAEKQVTGKVRYVSDMLLPGMLYAKGVYSTEHHAEILSIDTSAAEAFPGVRAVVTHEDVPYNHFGKTIDDMHALAERKVRYKGEMVAAVAAESYDAACRAAELVKVAYKRLPAVFDPREAMKEGAPVIHDELQGKGYEGNIHTTPWSGELYQRLRCGDIEEGFRQSDVVLEHTFATCPQKALPIENSTTVAVPDGSDGVTLWTGLQGVFANAESIAKVLCLPFSKVRIICPPTGGAFGEKDLITTEPATAILAIKTGRPVKMALTTREHLLSTGTKHPMYLTYTLGAKNDGTLMALKRLCITGAGAYRSVGILVTVKTTYWGCGPYNIPNQYADCYVVATNKQTGCAMRGFGMTQPTFAMEVMMDMMAEKLCLDPLEIRKRNIFKDGDRLPTGQAVRACGIGLALDKVAELSNWQAAPAPQGSGGLGFRV